MLTLTLISVGVGLALAALYQVASTRLHRWVACRPPSVFMAVTVSSFLVRLTTIAVILVIVGLWTPLNIVAVCAAFAGAFTILNAVSVGVLLARNHSPHSAGGKAKTVGETDAGC